MSTQSLAKLSGQMPAGFDDFFKPWTKWFDNGIWREQQLTMPAANIAETKDNYQVSLAAPGMKREDFSVDIEGNLLTVSCHKEEKREEKDEKYNRKEYNFSSFSRSFTLPDEVNREKIEARYEEGVLKLLLPKKDEAKKPAPGKHISVK